MCCYLFELSVFKALCSKCILFLLLQLPNIIVLLLSMFLIRFVHINTHISLLLCLFSVHEQTQADGQNNRGDWLLQNPATAGLMLRRSELGSSAHFELLSWKYSKVLSCPSCPSLWCPGRLWRVFLGLSDQSFFFSPRDTHACSGYAQICTAQPSVGQILPLQTHRQAAAGASLPGSELEQWELSRNGLISGKLVNFYLFSPEVFPLPPCSPRGSRFLLSRLKLNKLRFDMSNFDLYLLKIKSKTPPGWFLW